MDQGMDILRKMSLCLYSLINLKKSAGFRIFTGCIETLSLVKTEESTKSSLRGVIIEILVISSNPQNLFSNSSATRGIPSFLSGNGANTAIFMILLLCVPNAKRVYSERTLSTDVCTAPNAVISAPFAYSSLGPSK